MSIAVPSSAPSTTTRPSRGPTDDDSFSRAPASRPGLAGDLWTVGSATLVGHLIGLATSVSLRWLLEPAHLGVWQSLRVFLSYGNYLNLGASKGAARELSVASGRGLTPTIRRDLNLAHTVNTLSSLVYAAILAGASCWWMQGVDDLSHAWGWGFAFLAIFVVLQRHLTFHITLLRAEQRFGIAARQSVFEAAALLALGAVGAWGWGLLGLYAATLLVTLGSLVYLRRRANHALAFAWDTAAIGRLIGIGGPILLTGVLTTLFRSLDRLAILTFSSQAAFDVGCYSTAWLVGGQLYGLASMTGSVTSPKWAQFFGATDDKSAVAGYAAETTLWQSVWLAPVGAAAIVVGPALLGALFPDYRSGLVTLPWVVCGTLLSSIALPASNALIAVSRERTALAVLAAATLFAASALALAGNVSPGLMGIAAAACLGQAGYALAAGWFGLWRPLPWRPRLRSMGLHLLALTPTVAVALLAERRWPGAGDGSWNDAQTALLKLLWVGLAWSASIGLLRYLTRSSEPSRGHYR